MSLAEVQVYVVPAASDPEAPLQWLDAGDDGLAPPAGLGARRACLPFSFQVPTPSSLIFCTEPSTFAAVHCARNAS